MGSSTFGVKLGTQRHFSTILHVYVHPNNENSDQLYGDMVEKSTAILQEATSQLPPDTPIKDVIVPKDADVQIVTEVNSLKKEVTTLRGQVVAQGERMNMIVQALAMSGLQIPTIPAPNIAPPSTSQPFCPDDTE
ncbi:unnamed protein product [Malus baccata var. baccata]